MSPLRNLIPGLALLLLLTDPAVPAARPNIVFILTDNHGAWTLGCYGNQDIRTPNIDRLASEGMLFTRAMSSNPVCSPTRATFLTGLIPSQHGLHSFLDNKYMVGPEAYYTLKEFETLPRILHSEGYVCGLSGKWHLGANMTPQDGFSYWITMVRGSTRSFYEDPIIQDGEIRKTPKYMTDLWTEHAIRFIEQNRGGEKPFFLYYDMANDPQERFNLYGQPRHASIQKEMAEELRRFFEEYADPRYDIWKGGRSKARRLLAPVGHPDYRPLRRQ